MGHGNYVALFDVLGFEERLSTLGLSEMLARYEALIEAVNYRKAQAQHVFGTLGFSEAPYWTAEGDVFIFSETHGAYASYYDNTRDLVAFSQNFAGQFESLEETSVRSQYKPFSWSNTALSVRARAVRRVPL